MEVLLVVVHLHVEEIDCFLVLVYLDIRGLEFVFKVFDGGLGVCEGFFKINNSQ